MGGGLFLMNVGFFLVGLEVGQVRMFLVFIYLFALTSTILGVFDALHGFILYKLQQFFFFFSLMQCSGTHVPYQEPLVHCMGLSLLNFRFFPYVLNKKIVCQLLASKAQEFQQVPNMVLVMHNFINLRQKVLGWLFCKRV